MELFGSIFQDPITNEVPASCPKVGTYQYLDTLDFPFYCLLISTGSYATCSAQFNKAVSLYFKDYETGQKRKQCDEVDLDEHNAK